MSDSNSRRQRRGLLAHSAKAAEARQKFMSMRHFRTKPLSNGAQLRNFLLYDGVGMTCVCVFALVIFFSGVID